MTDDEALEHVFGVISDLQRQLITLQLQLLNAVQSARYLIDRLEHRDVRRHPNDVVVTRP